MVCPLCRTAVVEKYRGWAGGWRLYIAHSTKGKVWPLRPTSCALSNKLIKVPRKRW